MLEKKPLRNMLLPKTTSLRLSSIFDTSYTYDQAQQEFENKPDKVDCFSYGRCEDGDLYGRPIVIKFEILKINKTDNCLTNFYQYYKKKREDIFSI